MSILTAIFAFVLGLLVGSFLNVVIYRTPRHESIVFPASHCTKCKYKLKPWENIPVISYLILHGKCSHCATKISIQYPLIELLTGISFSMVIIRFGLSFEAFVYFVFTALLIILSVIDLHHKLLPDIFTLPGAIFACLISLLSLHPLITAFWPISPMTAFLGMIAGAGPLVLIAWGYYRVTKREGLGIGDIKLMIFVGALLGPMNAVLTLFGGALLGTIVGVPMTLLKKSGRYTEIPFGPYLSLAAWITALWGHDLIEFYLRFTHLA